MSEVNQLIRLGDLCDSISGLWTGKKPPFEKATVIRNTNFTKDCKLDLSNVAVLDVETKQLQTRTLIPGDLIVEKSGGGPKQPVGRVVYFNEPIGTYSLSNFTSALRLKDSSTASPLYLQHFLYYQYVSGVTESMQSHSTGIRNLNIHQFLDIKVPLPSLEKQLEVVKKLDSAFAEIDSVGESIANRIKNASELFAEICLMKTNDLNPTGFKSLKEIASVITKGTTPTSLGYRFTSSGINFLKVESLDENGAFIENKFAFIDSVCHESLKRSQLMENDVLLSIAGALGRTAIVTADVCPANVNQALSLIRLPKDSEISPKFLIALFQSGYFRTDLDRMGAGAAQQNLSLAQIGSLKVPIFPESKQKEFIDFLYNLSGLITDLKAQLEYQYLLKSELQKSILAKTFLHSTDSELVA
jgi:type I restriction enzyme S subunit